MAELQLSLHVLQQHADSDHHCSSFCNGPVDLKLFQTDGEEGGNLVFFLSHQIQKSIGGTIDASVELPMS